jgi:transcriptional regulator with XRE-family HTH domain
MTIGELIHNRRKELKLTLEEVGNAVGVSKSTVRKWETGYISNMKRDKIALLAKTLNLSPAQFIVESNEEIVQNKPNHELINKYEQLNESGQSKLMERLDELLELPKYRK